MTLLKFCTGCTQFDGIWSDFENEIDKKQYMHLGFDFIKKTMTRITAYQFLKNNNRIEEC